MRMQGGYPLKPGFETSLWNMFLPEDDIIAPCSMFPTS